jgi:hypothetical protein
VNFADMRLRTNFLAVQAMGSQAPVPAPDLVMLVNDAYGHFSWDTEFNEEQLAVQTVTNQAIYNIPTPYFKAIKEMAYTVASTGGSIRLVESTETDERNMDPLWFLRPMTASPMRYLTTGPNAFRLVDMPATTGDTVTIRGTRMPPPLQLDTDTPIVPDPYHEAIVLLAAVHYCEALTNEELDTARIAKYEAEYWQKVRDCRTWLASQRYRTLRRQVRRGYRGRVANYGYGNYY